MPIRMRWHSGGVWTAGHRYVTTTLVGYHPVIDHYHDDRNDLRDVNAVIRRHVQTVVE